MGELQAFQSFCKSSGAHDLLADATPFVDDVASLAANERWDNACILAGHVTQELPATRRENVWLGFLPPKGNFRLGHLFLILRSIERTETENLVIA